MKRLLLLSIMLIAISLSFAQNVPEWEWAVSAGSTGNDGGFGVAVDGQDNLYMMGRFSETITFGTTTLTSAGARDIWVGKMDANHNWLWIRQVRTTGDDTASTIEVDSDGNAYITGTLVGSPTFGTITINSYGGSDAFVAKLDTDGNWLWANLAGGASYDAGWDVVVDSEANVYLTGIFSSTASFGSLSLTSNGNWDAFTAKLDTDGNWLWAVGAGGTGPDYNYGIGVDSAYNVYVTGTFQSTISFGAITLYSGGTSIKDSYVAQLDSNGNWMWAVDTVNSSHVESLNLTVDSADNVYVTGCFQGSATFGDTQTITSSGGYDIFVAKIDAFSNWLWAAKAGDPIYADYGYWLATDSDDNAYLVGYFSGTAAIGSTTLASSGGEDIFAAKLDPNGSWLWAKQAGGVDNDKGMGIVLDSQANIYVIGGFTQTANFGELTLTSVGLYDFFVAQLVEPVGIDDDTTPGLPELSCLYNAYPNPFRSGSSALIKTYITDRETGSLSVYNLKGQRVASFELSPGKHDISFDGKDFASGIYFYQLKTQSVDTVKKLVLLK